MPLPDQPTFARFLGIKLVSVTPDRVEAELAVREEFKNRGGEMHGGALMAYADSLGGTTAHANLKRGQRTTTIESKTNFSPAFRSAMWRAPKPFRCTADVPPSWFKPASARMTASSPRS